MSTADLALQSVLAESHGPIRVLTLNRPEKLNAIDLDMELCLLARLKAVAADDAARVLILAGAGRAFCAGGDRKVQREVASGDMQRRAELGRAYLETMRSLMELSIPVIAAVHGLAVGFGAGLVALCDMVVMGDDAILSDPHVKFGIPGDPIAQLMWPRLTSRLVAAELLLSGREVDAHEAVRLGLASRTCPSGQERAVAVELANHLVALPPAGIAITKRILNRGLVAEFEALFAAVSAAV